MITFIARLTIVSLFLAGCDRAEVTPSSAPQNPENDSGTNDEEDPLSFLASGGPNDRVLQNGCRDSVILRQGEMTFIRFPGLNSTVRVATEVAGSAAELHKLNDKNGVFVLKYKAPPKIESNRVDQIIVKSSDGAEIGRCQVNLLEFQQFAIKDDGVTRGLTVKAFSTKRDASEPEWNKVDLIPKLNRITNNATIQCSNSTKRPCRLGETYLAAGPSLNNPGYLRVKLAPDFALVEEFGLQLSGLIHLPVSGEWEFKGIANHVDMYKGIQDAGLVNVFINGNLVFGQQYRLKNMWQMEVINIAPKTKFNLERGFHTLHVEYINLTGKPFFAVEWKIPGSKSFTAIPAHHIRRSDNDSFPLIGSDSSTPPSDGQNQCTAGQTFSQSLQRCVLCTPNQLMETISCVNESPNSLTAIKKKTCSADGQSYLLSQCAASSCQSGYNLSSGGHCTASTGPISNVEALFTLYKIEDYTPAPVASELTVAPNSTTTIAIGRYVKFNFNDGIRGEGMVGTNGHPNIFGSHSDYKWEATGGNLHRKYVYSGSAYKYDAPETPGTYKIKITLDKNWTFDNQDYSDAVNAAAGSLFTKEFIVVVK